MELMIQSQNNCIQSQTDCLKSFNRLEAKVSHLVNTINDRNEETLPNILLIIPDSSSHIDLNLGPIVEYDFVKWMIWAQQ